MPQRSHPAVSRDFPPSPATGEKTKLGHYRYLQLIDNQSVVASLLRAIAF
jgi:hypothetical protein